MSSPLQFYRKFQNLLKEHRISHVLTSGMACVEYGLQQTTKDTDWIIASGHVQLLSALFQQLERGLTGMRWRVSYRPLFGAPLDEEYLAAGWTSHLLVVDEPLSPVHHLDFFVQPPRLAMEAAFVGATSGVASPLVIAQMKKTDRDKDWPMVEALSRLAARLNLSSTVLHVRSPELLGELWAKMGEPERVELSKQRPLLQLLDRPDTNLRRLLAIERALWEEINKLRYRRYQSEWKDFLRRWRQEDDFAWPNSASFEEQHHLLSQTVRRFGLPTDPLGGVAGRQSIRRQAIGTVAEIYAAELELVQSLCPPLHEVLP